MVRRTLKYLVRVLTGMYRWRNSGKRLAPPRKKQQRILYLNLEENKFERYLYLFVKFFLLDGYAVYIKRNYRFLGDLEQYSKWILKEDGVFFCTRAPQKTSIIIEDDPETAHTFLSYDYFSRREKSDSPVFFVPMAMHPYLYKDLYWDVGYGNEKRYRSVFFGGSFRKDAYHHLTSFNAFPILNRLELYERIVSMNEAVLPSGADELNDINEEGKIILVDRGRFSISQGQWRRYLSRFDFFLACPGVSMPLAHNIVEAMSCGCIPIIEEGYASLFIPPLTDHQNAIFFNQATHQPEEVLRAALKMPDDAIKEMQSHVLRYYEHNLTPHAVVKAIEETKPRTIFLNAEAHSVRLISEHR